jgi:3-methyladenine DNA glycosylase Tag
MTPRRRREYGAPAQVDDPTPADYLEVITKAVFQSGMSWDVIEAKWAGFREAFAGFDPPTVAGLGPDEIEQLAGDTRIVRNRRKIEATVENAQALIALDEDTPGGFGAWLGSHGGFEQTLDALRSHFKYLGDFGSYYLLHVVKQPVPPYEEARALIDSRR